MSDQDVQITNLAHAYRVLDVPHDASPRAIKAAYRRLVKRWHPDRYSPGSEEQVDATLMTRLLNAAYARIEGAPLQAGFATPFSTPRNAPAGSRTSQNPSQPRPVHDAHPHDREHNEYSVRDNKDVNEAFYRILSENRKAQHSKWDDVSFERIRYAIDFIMGALAGGFLGDGVAHLAASRPSTAGITMRVVLGAIICAPLAGRFGFPSTRRYGFRRW